MEARDMTPNGRTFLARFVIVVIAAWVAAGALFKLFWGTPALLPAAVRDLGLDLGLTYNLAIGIELAVVVAALSKPRWGWLAELLLLAVFDVVLTTQIAAGDANCGCFGAKLSVPPWLMLSIDSALLVGLLLTRPWSGLGKGAPPVAVLAGAAVALALPWFFDREIGPGEVNGAARDAWVELAVEDWVGQDIWETPLGKPPLAAHLDVNALPLDGLWVFWRQTCDHCAKHLVQLAESEHGERLLTLVQLEERGDTLANRVVHVLPDGNFVQHARLPATFQYVIQTPAEMVLEQGKVVSAKEGVNHDEEPR